MSEKKEFAEICSWLSEFCANPETRSFRSKLKKAGELNLKGLEKWLQVEFSIFLYNQPNIVFENGSRECRYILDARKADRCAAYADFSFRKKHTRKDWRIVLEFKANDSQASCIREMRADCEKIWSVKGSNDDMRAFWVVGLHKSNSKSADELKEKALKLINEKHELDIKNYMLECMLIGKTGYALTVF